MKFKEGVSSQSGRCYPVAGWVQGDLTVSCLRTLQPGWCCSSAVTLLSRSSCSSAQIFGLENNAMNELETLYIAINMNIYINLLLCNTLKWPKVVLQLLAAYNPTEVLITFV